MCTPSKSVRAPGAHSFNALIPGGMESHLSARDYLVGDIINSVYIVDI